MRAGGNEQLYSGINDTYCLNSHTVFNLQTVQKFTHILKKLDKVNCARLRRPYVGLGGSVKVMGECSVSQLILGVMRF